jgi:hypothetical protein
MKIKTLLLASVFAALPLPAFAQDQTPPAGT